MESFCCGDKMRLVNPLRPRALFPSYWTVGEEGKDESTGYLYLELKKEGAEEYRTIAIGQRAKKGKPIDFWGFVILDGRRIGYDLQLYKEIGSSKIPLDRREMKTELGEDNFFTTSQSEYKKSGQPVHFRIPESRAV